jgi:hypothetical protein
MSHDEKIESVCFTASDIVNSPYGAMFDAMRHPEPAKTVWTDEILLEPGLSKKISPNPARDTSQTSIRTILDSPTKEKLPFGPSPRLALPSDMGAAETVSLGVPSKSSRKADCTGEIKQAKCQWIFGLFPQTTICWNRLRRRRLEEPHRIAQV